MYDRKVEFEGTIWHARHGGPFDRGSADSYYGRGFKPHYYVGATLQSDLVERDEMSMKELDEYRAGFEWNEEYGDKKDWGER